MRDACQRIERYTGGVSWETFAENDEKPSTVIRQLEIIGEAGNRIDPTVQARHPAIPWRHTKALRNLLIHGYDDVHLEQIWDIVQTDVPVLLRSIDALIASMALEDRPPEAER